jgi:hypothetical protein
LRCKRGVSPVPVQMWRRRRAPGRSRRRRGPGRTPFSAYRSAHAVAPMPMYPASIESHLARIGHSSLRKSLRAARRSLLSLSISRCIFFRTTCSKHPPPRLHQDRARRCHVCTRPGLTPAHICTRPGSSRPHLHQDRAPPVPRLHQDWARPAAPGPDSIRFAAAHICARTAPTPCLTGCPHLHRDCPHRICTPCTGVRCTRTQQPQPVRHSGS